MWGTIVLTSKKAVLVGRNYQKTLPWVWEGLANEGKMRSFRGEVGEEWNDRRKRQ